MFMPPPCARYAAFTIAVALIAMLAAACGDDDNGSATPTTAPVKTTQAAAATPTSAPVTGKITVFAASSLTAPFNEIGDAFKSANPGAAVEFNFAGSPALRTQLEQGARADVLAVADKPNMQQALDKQLVKDAGEAFARNKLAIAVPKSNSASITTPADLAKPGIKLVLAQKDVPVGNYARQSIDKMAADPAYGADFSTKVLANVVSEEPNVKAVVTQVQLGQADAAIVYVTDISADIQADVTMIPIPDQFNIIAEYPIAITSDASNPAGARAFIDFVLSDAGKAILKEYGFITD